MSLLYSDAAPTDKSVWISQYDTAYQTFVSAVQSSGFTVVPPSGSVSGLQDLYNNNGATKETWGVTEGGLVVAWIATGTWTQTSPPYSAGAWAPAGAAAYLAGMALLYSDGAPTDLGDWKDLFIDTLTLLLNTCVPPMS